MELWSFAGGETTKTANQCTIVSPHARARIEIEHLSHSNRQAPAQEGGDTGLAAQAILILCCPVYYFTSNRSGCFGCFGQQGTTTNISLCAQESIIPRSHKYHSSPACTSQHTHTLSLCLSQPFDRRPPRLRIPASPVSFDFTPPYELYYCRSSHLTGLRLLLRRVTTLP